MVACCSCPTTSAVRYELDSERSRLSGLVLGLLHLLSSTICVACGCLMLKYGSDDSDAPWTTGAPIWAGAITFICGFFGVLSSIGMIRIDARRILFYIHFGFCMLVLSLSAQVLTFSIRAYLDCTDVPEVYCEPNKDILITMAIVSMAMAAVFIVTSLGEIIHYSTVHRRAVSRHKLDECSEIIM